VRGREEERERKAGRFHFFLFFQPRLTQNRNWGEPELSRNFRRGLGEKKSKKKKNAANVVVHLKRCAPTKTNTPSSPRHTAQHTLTQSLSTLERSHVQRKKCNGMAVTRSRSRSKECRGKSEVQNGYQRKEEEDQANRDVSGHEMSESSELSSQEESDEEKRNSSGDEDEEEEEERKHVITSPFFFFLFLTHAFSSHTCRRFRNSELCAKGEFKILIRQKR
jgi:hypothetical protein